MSTHRSINLNSLLHTLNSGPPPVPAQGSGVLSSPFSIMVFNCTHSFHRIHIFSILRMMRNAAETEVPMIPPTLLKEPNRSETAAAVAATTIEVMITILCED